MTFVNGFDRFANVWCKKCGRGDTIMGHRQMRRHETFQVENVEQPDGWAEDVTEDPEGETLYTCSFCNNEGTELEEVATGNQNEAHNIFRDSNISRRVAKVFGNEERESTYENEDE